MKMSKAPFAATFTGDMPCTDQPFVLSSKTDTDGAFDFKEVPIG
jgi:hypothetical protein